MAPAYSSQRSKKSNKPSQTQFSNQGVGRPQTSTQEFNPRKIFVGGLPHETNNGHLRAVFQKYGSIVDAVVLFHPDGRPRGFGYVTFSQADSALSALADKPHLILAQEVDAKRAVPGTNKIFVGGLHQLVTDADLRACFSAFGEVADAYVLPDMVNGRSRGFGFVSYMPGTEGAEAVEKAVAKCHHWLHGKRVEAKRAKTPHQMATEAGKAGQDGQAGQAGQASPPQVTTTTTTSTTSTTQPKKTPAWTSGAGAPVSSQPVPPFSSSASVAAPLPPGLFHVPEMSVATGEAMKEGMPLPPGLDGPAMMTTPKGNGEAVKTQQSSSPSSTTTGSTVCAADMVKKDSDEAASSPSATPKDSPMMLKPLLQLTPEAAAASPSFGDSPKRLTFKTAPVGFWRNLGGDVAGSDAGIDAGTDASSSRWPVSSSKRSIAHLGPPPGIFTKKSETVEMRMSPAPKHGPMLLGFEKLAMSKKGK